MLCIVKWRASKLLQLWDRLHDSLGDKCGWTLSGDQVLPPIAEKEADKGCGEHQLSLWLHFCKLQWSFWRDASSVQLQQGCHQHAYAFFYNSILWLAH